MTKQELIESLEGCPDGMQIAFVFCEGYDDSVEIVITSQFIENGEYEIWFRKKPKEKKNEQ